MFEKFNRLLVTTDFSEVGDRALAHAFRIAADQGAHVVLCHVVESIARPHPLYAHHYPRDPLYPTNPDADRTVRHALLERTPRSGPLAIVPYATVVAFGSPAEEILRVAHQQEIDLIVLATHGRTGLKRALLGSVADRVVRLARCAVLVVR